MSKERPKGFAGARTGTADPRTPPRPGVLGVTRPACLPAPLGASVAASVAARRGRGRRRSGPGKKASRRGRPRASEAGGRARGEAGRAEARAAGPSPWRAAVAGARPGARIDVAPARWIWLPCERTLAQHLRALAARSRSRARWRPRAAGSRADSRYRLFVNGRRVQWDRAL